ncbi:hypothetical protein FVEN_g7788 [Fusarium venenatum]|uniref:CBM-cenC domain-containing protein n=1 Tax=Fusarium venenatum TaxID=56646 RepID=A0A2L2TRV4_9HYPO|nr:uncharacterized protein FVRRES_08014 [Fusarium venenatum]KAG8354450.1 hypothetical protein FVEN_g7788 [Fusarium venenatum]KAH6964802.1 hypothetical protein EDB82DRAFT_479190 [Fusarium venenatum]CEI67937.1 unnamed protein product [Fusarium venenatum]
MRVPTTFGSLILSASLVAARACAPHPRPTTITSASGVDTKTDVRSASSTLATTTSGLTSQETTTVTESQTDVESFVTLSTSLTEEASLSTQLSTTFGPTSQETLTTTEFDTAVTSSATLSTFETSTTSADTTSKVTEVTTTTASPPVETTNIVQNGGFEDSTIEPWEVIGTTPFLRNFSAEKGKSLSLPRDFTDNAAIVCQRVAIEQGFEYTFKASVAQYCIFSFGSNIVACEDNANKIQLTVDGVSGSDSGELGIIGYNTFNEVSNTFSYIGPSIDQTDLCITIKVAEAAYYIFYLDDISLIRGRAIPIPEETD